MASDPATLIRDALALDVDTRAILAHALLGSLHDAEAAGDADSVWHEEAIDRLAQVRAGTVQPTDADEHYARLRASLEG
ncbi:MAG: addiction module protein [Mobilicoccus sp.]|nr:addiction module protein [Mobilicoccus sp.]